MASSCTRLEVQNGDQEEFLPCQDFHILEWAAQGGGKVTISGGAQETTGYST